MRPRAEFRSWPEAGGTKLEGMEQAAAPEPSSAASSFAGFLASLAAPREASSPTWKGDELADDIATLSYEQALRAHTRYRAPEDHAAAKSGSYPQRDSSAGAGDGQVTDASSRSTPGLKRASITIRLSEAECAQVRARAAEAGLTVSAYLRSCALDVESLRTQVKETLAHLRSTKTRLPEKTKDTSGGSKAGLWLRFWRFARHTAPARS
jgi:hypothetical protein